MKEEFKSIFGFGVVLAILPIIFLLIVSYIRDYLLIDYIHVLSAALWLGSNLFMGFIFYKIILDLGENEQINITKRLIPLTMFFLPAITSVTIASGYMLAFHLRLFSYSYLIYLPIIIISSVLFLFSFIFYLYDSVKIYYLLYSKHKTKEIVKLSIRNFKTAFVQLILQIIIIGLMAYVVIVF